MEMGKESGSKGKGNKRPLDEEPDMGSQERYNKKLIIEYGRALQGPGKEMDDSRTKAEQFHPHNLYASQMPRLIGVTILEKDTLVEVR